MCQTIAANVRVALCFCKLKRMEIHVTPQTEQELKEHDASFRAAIQEALDDPRPLVPHAEVEAHFAKLRADLLSKDAYG